jgi:hypothetical protein
MENEVKKALGGKRRGNTHTHEVTYKRAGNGGFIAHVHKHHGKGPHSEGFSHTEEHVLPDMEAAQGHMDAQMGDQPATGAAPEAPEEAEDQAQDPAAAMQA